MSIKKKIMIIFGTRPEAIKLAPVIQAFKENANFETSVVVSAQHQEMLYQVLDLFDIKPEIDLQLMKPKQSLFELSANLLTKLQQVLEDQKPDLVILQGDTTTTFIASLAAFYLKIPVAHVEAGLRSFNAHHPFPEEMNRVLTSSLANFHFAPTLSSKENLLKQGIDESSIYIVGNTVVDSLNYILFKGSSEKGSDKFILVTAHRRENWGKPIAELCKAINMIAALNPDIRFIFSVHKNPVVRETVFNFLGDNNRVKLIESQDYLSFIRLLNNCYFAISDSGGIQEEAPALGKPLLVFRETTERPEGVEAGLVKLVGCDAQKIVDAAIDLLNNAEVYASMSNAQNLYGDGTTSQRIVEIVSTYYFGAKSAFATTASL